MKLTAYNAHESHRMPRLKLVAAMLEYRGQAGGVVELHDCKGELTAHWRHHPSQEEMSAVNEAWEYVCEWSVKHYLAGTLIAATDPGQPEPTTEQESCTSPEAALVYLWGFVSGVRGK